MKPYNKNLQLSYSVGVYSTIELLEAAPKEVVKVVVSPKGQQNKGVQKIKQLCSAHNIPLEFNEREVGKLTKSANNYAVGAFRKFEKTLAPNKNHLVLINPSDMGNLGTIIRTMVAFNVTDLALIRPAADIFDPKVVRSSMGSLFRINFQYFKDFEDYQKQFSNNYYSFMTDGNLSLKEVTFKPPFSMIFGNEGAGLEDSYRSVGESVKIPFSKNVDSLNLSVAVGISLFKASGF